ncbi:TetR/AcrR family transcriptional regulator [Leifsonia sp. YAF41]|uniref:TetR/AcrR family transcriptional regulator n=1 Tax=Leifsonia sp. YAF41 TaxID=3233086 RepID=UPI003F9E35CF
MQQLDGRRARGDESRRAVLARAVDIASVNGLEGLTIGRLAAEVSASKSGVAALFGTKEQLQLAAVETARGIFTASVIDPARIQPRGLRRVCALLRSWIDYSAGRVFEGGCFFFAVSAEFDSRPGVVHDAILRAVDERDAFLVSSIGHAVDQGELVGITDTPQLAFELTALIEASNSYSLLRRSAEPYEFARRGIVSRLQAYGADTTVLAKTGFMDPLPG